jgi:hypothetical protein
LNNPRITAKERGLLIGAFRRVFSRSDLRREVLESVKVVMHYDVAHPRVKHWSRCPLCKKISPRYLFVVDHIEPVVPVYRTQADMTWDEIIDAIWCVKSNLQPICKTCHKDKTAHERKLRKCHKAI